MGYQKNMGQIVQMVHVTNDYSCAAFSETFEQGGSTYYATFHPEAEAGPDGLVFTGRYLVVMLVPDDGTVVFYLTQQAGKWDLDHGEVQADYLFPVKPELLQWCDHMIQQHTKNPGQE
jgi:hypothetical protein